MKNIIIGILIVLALGAGWYYWSTNQNETTTTETTTQEDTTSEDTTTEESDSSNNLMSLLQSGENQMCTYSVEQNGNTISGVIYMSGENMRNNYELTGESEEIMGSMIKQGDTMYIWGPSVPQGIKMTFDLEQLQAQAEANPEQPQSTTPFDVTQDMEYSCDPWNVDETQFMPPANITFTDMSTMMETIPAMSDPEAACAMCESLTGENRDACRQEFNCQ